MPYESFHIESFGKVGNPVLIFIHGWPDSGSLWDNQVEYFSTNYHCITVTLPNFPGAGRSKWGLDFPDLTDALAQSLKTRLGDTSSSLVTVIGHDWGAILAYHLDKRYPDLFRRLITLDVGADVKPTSIAHMLFFVSYQWWLASAFLIGQAIPSLGNWMTAVFSKSVNAPRGREVTSQMNYFYFYVWRGFLFKRYGASLLNAYRPKKPTLFLYGERNKYRFFSERWREWVVGTPGGKVQGMINSDHWINIREPDRTNEIIDEWLSATSKNPALQPEH